MTASNVAVRQVEPASFDAGSASVDPKQPPMVGGGTDTESDMTRPTILDKTKRQIIDAVSKNRLTIVIGPTGWVPLKTNYCVMSDTMCSNFVLIFLSHLSFRAS